MPHRHCVDFDFDALSYQANSDAVVAILSFVELAAVDETLPGTSLSYTAQAREGLANVLFAVQATAGSSPERGTRYDFP